MSFQDDEDTQTTLTKGVLSDLNLNVKKLTKAGKQWKAHCLSVETEDGDTEDFMVSVKSPVAKFIAKLTEGDKITVKQVRGDYGLQVVAVFTDKGTKFSKNSSATFKRKEYDPTGPIQGMVLGSAVNLVASGAVRFKDLNATNAIIEAAKLILDAKTKVDAMVVKALKNRIEEKKDDDDSNNDSDDNDGDDSDEPTFNTDLATEEDEGESSFKESNKKKTKKSSESPY